MRVICERLFDKQMVVCSANWVTQAFHTEKQYKTEDRSNKINTLGTYNYEKIQRLKNKDASNIYFG